MEGGSYGSLVEAGLQNVLEGEQLAGAVYYAMQGLSAGGAAAFTLHSND